LEIPALALVRSSTQGAADPRTAAAASGIIRGRVVTTDGRAVPNASLRLTATFDFAKSRVGRADRDGRYEFSGLSAGKYSLVAMKVGFSPAAPNDPTAATETSPLLERLVDLAADETRERVDPALARWGSLSGRVLDEYG